MLKRVFIVASIALLGACATLGTKDYNAMAEGRKAPCYFAGKETGAAFKLNSSIRNTPLEGVLIVKKADNGDFNVKIMGPLGAQIVDCKMEDGAVAYNYVLPDINTGLIKNRFEKFIFALLSPAGEIKKAHFEKDGTLLVKRQRADGAFTYFYDENSAYPFKMSSGAASMEFAQYQPYKDGSLPYALTYYDSLADVRINLSLISIR